ncbi:MAG: family 10 glycosylhydrolase [Bacteroidota bacterium]
MKKNGFVELIKTGIFVIATITYLNGVAQQNHGFNMPFTQTSPFSIERMDTLNQASENNDNASRQILYPKRELRCAWIATVANIDYPTSTGQSVATLKSGYITLINILQKAGVNAVFVQIRPSCDAFYNSPYEPWSQWLSGTQGVAPAGGFDPLVFMIEETHNRGIEFHAWLNPYRAVASIGSSSIASNHVSVIHPSWCVTYNSIKLLNPGLPQVRDYVTMIVSDIVTRYKVDGIHFDDYFYPYPANGTAFNDNAAFSAYPRGFTNKNDWRRDNVNLFVKMVNDSIKSIRSWVKFGIGPFGIWKNGVPSGISGLSSYSEIYCDAIAWLTAQSVDYVAPQLYWKIGTNQDFNTLVDWWATQANNHGRHCYAGMASYQLNSSGGNWAINNILDQINSTRLINFKAQGEVFFSATSIRSNMKKLTDSLDLSFNKYKCLVPTMPWIDAISPLPPNNVTYTTTPTAVTLNWNLPLSATDGDTAKYFVIYRSTDGNAVDVTNAKQILYISTVPITTFIDTITVTSFPGVAYAITSCDKIHNESSVEYINVTVTVATNDNCANAQNLVPNISCVQVSGDLASTTASGVAKPSCDAFGSPALKDVWYKFTATDVTHNIILTPSASFDPVISLYTLCGAGEIGCADNGGAGVADTIFASGLNVGTTYYVRVYDYGSADPATTTFDICITAPSLPLAHNEAAEDIASSFDIFPNPFDGSILYGKFTNTNTKNIFMSVYDILGRTVFEKDVIVENGNFSFSFTEGLKQGVYLIVSNNNNGRVTKRVVVK